MSAKDKFGFEVISLGCDDEAPQPEPPKVADVKERLIWLYSFCERYSVEGQVIPLTVHADHVAVTCMVTHPCGHVTQLQLILSWDSLVQETSVEIERYFKLLLRKTGEEANKHTEFHMKGKKHD